MWRRCCTFGFSLRHRVSAFTSHTSPPLPFSPLLGLRSTSNPPPIWSPSILISRAVSLSHALYFSNSGGQNGDDEDEDCSKASGCVSDDGAISFSEAKRLLRLVNVEALKLKLGAERHEVIGYSDLLEACESMGVARNPEEAAAFARVLDEAGVILLFRNKVYLHPDKLVDLVRRAVPLALMPEDDPMREELKTLQQKKEEIDVLAHKQVRRILWTGLGLSVLQVGLFFWLTFWELSWDVMEPITFFTTAAGIVIGYAYFLFTSRDPTYQDLMKRLFLSRQRKLIRKHGFDVSRYAELQRKIRRPGDAMTSIRNRMGVELELEDALHTHTHTHRD